MKLFVLLPRVPFPLDKGDKLRAYYQLQQLSKTYDIYLYALNDGPVDPSAEAALQPFCKKMKWVPLTEFSSTVRALAGFVFSKDPAQVRYFYRSSIARDIQQEITAYQPDVIYCQLLRVAALIKDIDGIPKVIDYQDAFSAGMENRAGRSNALLKPFVKAEARRLARYEALLFPWFQGHTIISEQDRDAIQHRDKERIVVVKNGVDTNFFHPMDTEKRYDILFAGNMGYPPNITGAEYLVNEVLPLIHRQRPDTTVVIAGADPHARVKALAGAKVTVTGRVDDLRDAFAGSRMLLAPMQSGSGLQNKLLQAMAMRIPCITSQLSNNALGATHGEEILVGRSPENYAELALLLLNHSGEAEKIAGNGYRYIHDHFSWESATQPLADLLLSVQKGA